MTAVLERRLHAVGSPPVPHHHRTTVAVLAGDPLSGAGVAGQLRQHAELDVQPWAVAGADVVVVAADAVGDEQIRQVRAVTRGGSRAVVVATTLTSSSVVAAVDAGATTVLHRAEATPDALAAAVHGAARSDGVVPPDLLGTLMVGLAPAPAPAARAAAPPVAGSLSARELQVLELLADGRTTSEIARTLCYSERTIKNVIQALTSRLQLRNRTHAVAYAVRHGLV